MKSITTFLFFLLLITSAQAQSVAVQRTAELIPGDYAISGDAILESLTDGSLQLRLTSDFSTPTGPDVRILLSNQINLNGAVELVNLSDIRHFDGALTVEVPSFVDIDDYQFVLFYCVRFAQFWASGELGESVAIGSTLPVQLNSFSAKADNQDITLDWSTSSELNNSGFEIERSIDAKEFSQISFVDAQGSNDNRNTEYTFTDSDVQQNVRYYYRLKQVDIDGRFEYSGILNATIVEKDINSTTVSDFYPNPVLSRGITRLNITTETRSNASYALYNQNGRTVLTSQVQLENGFNNIDVNVENLPSGMYVMHILINKEVFYKKVIL